MHNKFKYIIILIPIFFFNACLDESDDSDETYTSTSDYYEKSSSSNCSNLVNLVSGYNSSDIQCSSQIANATIYYDAAVNACSSGERYVAGDSNYYSSNDKDGDGDVDYLDTYEVHKEIAEYAINVWKQLGCNDENTPYIQDDTYTSNKYIGCIKYTDSGTSVTYSCYTVQNGCAVDFSAVTSEYSSASECKTALENYLYNLGYY
jgi:hypothetical protein